VITLQDKTLTCRDCGQAFTFTVSEQEFFAQKGFTNSPSRCPECRAARKARQAATGRTPGGFGSFGGYVRREREMFPAVCSQCGKATTVPFQPRGDRPVYCSDCYATQRPSYSSERRSSGRRDW
jgi:CxxC-x17-CxxC domain-containing protein